MYVRAAEKNFVGNLLQFFYYNLRVASRRAYCILFLSLFLFRRTRSLDDRFLVVSGFAKEPSSERSSYQYDSGESKGERKKERKRQRKRDSNWNGAREKRKNVSAARARRVAKAFNFPLLADGGRHTPFRSELSLPESYGSRMSGWGGPNVA